MHEDMIYTKNEVKSLTFKWESNQEDWLSKNNISIKQILSEVCFVSASACGDKEKKLILFYIEPSKEKFVPKKWINKAMGRK